MAESHCSTIYVYIHIDRCTTAVVVVVVASTAAAAAAAFFLFILLALVFFHVLCSLDIVYGLRVACVFVFVSI